MFVLRFVKPLAEGERAGRLALAFGKRLNGNH